MDRSTFDVSGLAAGKSYDAKLSLAAAVCNVVDLVEAGAPRRVAVDFALGNHHLALLCDKDSDGAVQLWLYDSDCSEARGASLQRLGGYAQLKSRLLGRVSASDADFTVTVLVKGVQKKRKRVQFYESNVALKPQRRDAASGDKEFRYRNGCGGPTVRGAQSATAAHQREVKPWRPMGSASSAVCSNFVFGAKERAAEPRARAALGAEVIRAWN